MLGYMIFLILCLSGSVLGATMLKRRFEEVLPITCTSIILLIFICGILGHLDFGVILVCVIGFGVILYSIIHIIRNKSFNIFFCNMITPGFFLFLFLVFLFTYIDYGRLASSWDEFSHWTDIVKVMTTINDFGTNSSSHSLCQSYPPAMSIFQYFIEKVNFYIGKENYFCEWKIYLAYQILMTAFLFPIFNKLSFGRPIMFIGVLCAVFLAPLTFYSNIYTSTYIDGALGVLTGTGFALVLCSDKKDIVYSMQVFSICIMLVLMKDAGLLFSLVLALTYALDLSSSLELNNSGRFLIKVGSQLKIFSIAVAFVIIPNLLWKYEIYSSGATKVFSDRLDMIQLVKLLLSGEETYHKTVISSYWEAFFTQGVSLGNTNIILTYFQLIVLLLFIMFMLVRRYPTESIVKRKQHIRIAISFTMLLFIYIIGLCFTYVLNFTEYEALNLASFDRYINIAFSALWFFIVLLLLKMVINQEKSEEPLLVVLLGITILMVPMQNLYSLCTRTSIQQALDIREQYNTVCNKVAQCCDGNDNIYIISQEDSGFDYWVIRYSIRPNISNDNFTWSIGKAFYDGDIFSQELSADQWMDELVAHYDYVLLYKLNDYFYQNFSSLFDNPEDIDVNAIYYIDKESRLLIKQ